MLILAVRELTVADLPWFYETGSVYRDEKEYMGHERAVTINTPVMRRWFPDLPMLDEKQVYVQCRYLSGDSIVFEPRRPIRNQGSVGRWRLAGHPIRGEFYGTLRVGDLMLMAFETSTRTLSWLCVRGDNDKSARSVPPTEIAVRKEILGLLGEYNAGRGMWLKEGAIVNDVAEWAATIYPAAQELIIGADSDYRQTLRSLVNHYRTGGFTTGVAVEQIAYLLYLKYVDLHAHLEEQVSGLLDDMDELFFDRHGLSGYRWSSLLKWDGTLLQEEVLAALVTLIGNAELNGEAFARLMGGASLSLKTPAFLKEAMLFVEALPLQNQSGTVFQHLLSYLEPGASDGTYPTPRHIAATMVRLAETFQPEDVVDPVCGTGAFLTEALRQGVVGDHQRVVGYEAEGTLARLAALNLRLSGVQTPRVYALDSLIVPWKTSDHSLALANLVRQMPAEVSSESQKGSPDLLLTLRILGMLRAGGRAVVLVPESFLFGMTGLHRQVRRILVEENALEAVISLPAGVFQPYSSVKSSILMVRRGGQTDRVFFFNVTGDGYTLNRHRLPDPENDNLRLVVDAFRNGIHYIHEEDGGGQGGRPPKCAPSDLERDAQRHCPAGLHACRLLLRPAFPSRGCSGDPRSDPQPDPCSRGRIAAPTG